jgi:probable HAF family extracellular repeat protein
MKSFKLLSTIIVAGTLAACSPSPLPDTSNVNVNPPGTSAPGTPDSSNPGSGTPDSSNPGSGTPDSSNPGTPAPPTEPPVLQPPVVQPPVVNPTPPTVLQPPVTAIVCTAECLYTVESLAPRLTGTTLTKLTSLSPTGDVFGTRNDRRIKLSNGSITQLPVMPSEAQPANLDEFISDQVISENDSGDVLVSKQIGSLQGGIVRNQTWFVPRFGNTRYKADIFGIDINLSAQQVLSKTSDRNVIWNSINNTQTVMNLYSVRAFNNFGVAVGERGDIPDGPDPASERNGVVTPLGSLHPSGFSKGAATDINNVGVIVGHSKNADGQKRAFRYFNGAAGKKMYPMQTADCRYTEAIAINDFGFSVLNGTQCPTAGLSSSALLSKPDLSTINLNLHIPVRDGWVLTSVVDINRRGQILALATLNGERTYVKLNPN